jgi:ATP-dependent RNA helicase DeaD
VTLVSGAGIYKLQSIERFTKVKIRREHVPTAEAVESRRSDALFERLRDTLEAGEFAPRTQLVERLLEQGYTPTEVAAAILHHFAPPAAVRPDGDAFASPPPDDDRPRGPRRFDKRRGGEGPGQARGPGRGLGKGPGRPRKFGPRGGFRSGQ